MKLPEVIKVAGFDIKVTPQASVDCQLSQCFGEFIALTGEIRIDPSTHPYKVFDTVVHELLHAIFWAYSINDEDKEEQICRVLSTAFTQILRDNEELIKFIQNTFIEEI